MIILPAIDLLDGKVVRLFQGDYQQKEIFGEDPVAFAQEFQNVGATHLHLVDLNGAKEGSQVGLFFEPEDIHVMRFNESEEDFDARLEQYEDEDLEN